LARSGLQALSTPAICCARKQPTVVQTVIAAMPELDALWHESKPAPERGPWNLGGRAELALYLLQLGFENMLLFGDDSNTIMYFKLYLYQPPTMGLEARLHNLALLINQ
jgi:hypothetical protein